MVDVVQGLTKVTKAGPIDIVRWLPTGTIAEPVHGTMVAKGYRSSNR